MICEKIGRRITSLIDERGITRYRLSRKCKNLSRSTVYNAADGKNNMRVETVEEISRALEVPAESLLIGDKFLDMNLTNDERLLIESLRELDDKRQERIMGYVKALKEESE